MGQVVSSITERSFAKDWKPKYPLYPHQRMRNVVAPHPTFEPFLSNFKMGGLEPPKLLLLL
eukprot:SAG22_NODE_427_length_10603_cov_19.158225_3_plen_61_part_00